MEVHLDPDVESKLEKLSRDCGRPTEELVMEAVTGYVEGLDEVRQSLNFRYDEIKSGKVELMDSEAALALLNERIESRRNRRT